MKSDLIITRYKTEKVIGTKSAYDERTYFGSKMIDIEDSIDIDNSIIQYSEVYNSIDKSNNGYQYYIDSDDIEKKYLVKLYTIKNDNHTMSLNSQSTSELRTNTKWLLIIDWKSILLKYLYLKIKESRTFKTIKNSNVLNENINYYIKSYITNNLMSRYDFNTIDLYIKYVDLDSSDIDKTPDLLLEPIFDENIMCDEYKVKDANTNISDVLTITYNQIESSQYKKIHYYFNLNIIKI